MGVRALVEWVAGGLVAAELLVTAGWVGSGTGVGLLAASLVVAALATVRRSSDCWVAAATLASGAAGVLLAAGATAVPVDPRHVAHLPLPVRTRVVGRVVGNPVADARRTIVVLDVSEVGQGATRRVVSGRVRIRVRGRTPIARGDLVAVEATLRRPRNFENPGRFDVVGSLARQRVHVVGSVWDPGTMVRLAPAAGSLVGGTLDAWRADVRTVIATVGDPAVAGVLLALVLGDERDVGPELRNAFTRAGVVHVLSVSGLHVGIVTAAAAGVLLWVLGLSEAILLHLDRRKLAIAGGLAAAILYGALTGFAVATLRSLAMAGVVGAALFLDRAVAPRRALALAAILIAVMQPGAPADVSFQLSFVSVAALVIGATERDADGRSRVVRWLGRVVRASVAAWIGTAPLTAFHFHQVSLVSVVANPIVIPLFEGASVLPGLAGAVLAPVAPGLAGSLFGFAGLPVELALTIVRTLGGWSWAACDVPLPSLGELGLLYGAIGGAVAWRTRAGRLVLAACLVSLAVDAGRWAYERTSTGSARVTFLDVGQGDAAVVELAGGRVLVIDAGGFPGSDFDTGAAIVEPFLRARKIARVDALVMSHAHPDHAGGLAHLVRRAAPAEVWWAGLGGVGTAWDEVVRALRETGTPVRILHAGATIPEFPEITVLHPTATWPARSLNDASLVLRVVGGSAAMLFTGDAERDAEAAMVHGGGDLTAAVLKVPHHGSHTSSTPPFLEAVDPALAAVSVGADNRFRHPAPDVEARYARRGIVLRRTDRCGAITVIAVPGGLDVSASRPACPPAVVRTRPPP